MMKKIRTKLLAGMKVVRAVFAVLLAAVTLWALIFWLTGCRGADTVDLVSPQAVTNRPLTPYMSYYHKYNTSDNWAILVDLSDRTNYPHVLTNEIILKSMRYGGDLNDAKYWHLQMGVVTAVTTATTDIEWIWGAARVRASAFDQRWELPEHGLSLAVVGGTLSRVATIEITSTGLITSSTLLSTTVGPTGTVGVGDLILFTDEVTDTAVLHLGMNISYNTE